MPPIPKPINAAPAIAKAEQKRPPRISITNAQTGVIHAPIRVFLCGVDKIGKTTFGACAPSPFFFGAEDGSNQFDVARAPRPIGPDGDPMPLDWSDLFDVIEQLTNEAHSYKTLVMDTVDWLEPVVQAYVCARDGKKAIEDYGHGKGYTTMLDEWRLLTRVLDRMIYKRRMNVVLLGHVVVKTFKNPLGEDYDRFEVPIYAKAAGHLRQWADAALFANHETYSVEAKNGDRHIGVSSGRRVVYTERSAAWDAGNRYTLPLELPLSWDAFYDAVRASTPKTLEQVTEELAALVARVPESARAAVQKQIDDKAGNVTSLERYAAALADRLASSAA